MTYDIDLLKQFFEKYPKFELFKTPSFGSFITYSRKLNGRKESFHTGTRLRVYRVYDVITCVNPDSTIKELLEKEFPEAEWAITFNVGYTDDYIWIPVLNSVLDDFLACIIPVK